MSTDEGGQTEETIVRIFSDGGIIEVREKVEEDSNDKLDQDLDLDLDHDGEEDSDHDSVVNADETDPYNEDTDGMG